MRMRKRQLGDQVDPVMGGGEFGKIKLNRGKLQGPLQGRLDSRSGSFWDRESSHTKG